MSCDGSGEFKSVLQDLRTGTFLGTVLVNDRVLPSKNAACTIAIDAPKVPVGSTSSGLFEGRFRSSLIEADTYLLACQRYIELNPVRASMVSVPGDYRWSSHRANALGRQDSVVTPHPLYQGLADSDQARFACVSQVVRGYAQRRVASTFPRVHQRRLRAWQPKVRAADRRYAR